MGLRFQFLQFFSVNFSFVHSNTGSLDPFPVADLSGKVH